MRRSASGPTTLVLLASIFAQASCMCYNPNGTAVYNWSSSSVVQSCSNDSSNPLSSICCATNRDNPSGGSLSDGFAADICLPNALCKNVVQDSSGDLVYSYWRDYCTESDFTSNKCLNVCTGSGEYSDDGTAVLTPCGNTETATKWCCGRNNTDCCSSNNPSDYQAVAQTLGQSISSTASASTKTASATASVSTTGSASATATSSTSPITNKDTSSGLSTGAKAGIGVGVAIGGAALLGIAAIILLRRRRNSNSTGGKAHELSQTEYTSVPKGSPHGPPAYAAHGYFNGGINEAGGREISEMASPSESDVKVTKFRHEAGSEPVELA